MDPKSENEKTQQPCWGIIFLIVICFNVHTEEPQINQNKNKKTKKKTFAITKIIFKALPLSV